jgi:hypothetical protein
MSYDIAIGQIIKRVHSEHALLLLMISSKPLELKPRLQLEHPRRIDIREGRDSGRSSAVSPKPNKLTKVRVRRRSVTPGCNSPREHIRMIEDVKSLET